MATPTGVRKAVIPAAGFGTRLFPATKAVKKELFPIIDQDGRAKPVILAIVEEALSAGIESLGIVVQPSDRQWFEDFFTALPEGDYLDKLIAKHEDYLHYLQALGQRIHFIIQDRQEGFGHAVFCAKEWVNNEPFLLLLGDHIYTSNHGQSCAQQVIAVYEQYRKSVVAIETAPVEEMSHRGCVVGDWQTDTILTITRLVEKPTVEYAQQHLQVARLPADRRLAIFGLYVLEPKIFDYLEAEIRENQRDHGEFQLTTALNQLQQTEGMMGCMVQGKTFDIGLPDAYYQAVIEFRQANKPSA